MMKRSRGGLARSFGYAIHGVFGALARERNLRVHFAAGAFVLFCSGRYYSLSRAETALLVLAIGLVIAAEMVNTAVEKTVDLVTSDILPLAKTAKDVAAGAVLISAAASVAVGFLLFWDVPAFRRIWGDITANPLLTFWVLVLAAAWVWWPWGKE